MICPRCKKQNNKELSIDFISNINSFKRKRECQCGNKFITYEHVAPDNTIIDKINHKYVTSYTRKTPMRTLWQDWRFLNYARFLYLNLFRQLDKFLEKQNLQKKFDDEIIIYENIKSNIGGKIWYRLKDVKSKKIYEFQAKDLKMRSIREVLKNKEYWEYRKRYLKKEHPTTEQEKKDEARQFIKSLSHKKTGIRAKKYNMEFFKQDVVLSKMMIGQNWSHFWQLWKNLH